MASGNRVEGFDKTNARLLRMKDLILEAAKEEVPKTLHDINEEFGEYYKSVIKREFGSAVSEFYNAYIPRYYPRREGLYALLDIQKERDGSLDVSDDYMSVFNEDYLHGDRSGNSLFDKVFIQGWHGGAEGIGSNSYIVDPHPRPGVPYYRAPGPMLLKDGTRIKRYKYGRWGRIAIRTKSAYRIFIDEMSHLEGTELFSMFKQISAKHADILAGRLNGEILDRIRQQVD